MRVQYLSIITGACRARVASTSGFTRGHPSNLTTHFGPNSFIGVPFLYNFVILVGRVGHCTVRAHRLTTYAQASIIV